MLGLLEAHAGEAVRKDVIISALQEAGCGSPDATWANTWVSQTVKELRLAGYEIKTIRDKGCLLVDDKKGVV